ncbi:MAG: nucleoside/nucleotide kinase family protein [Salibaculum sp.]|jgi:pantothenate kinase|uniref:nucleoside/nucleotide kinase family protein n=1 Tax=Roseovarius halophilus (ex Wu et al. 2025) TaxID=3376060 RepID=UPI0028702F30|nr:nucleoside/nucleotide kinase family protein [Salibaculum sp.]MDR9426918.1 nucleoside/nucleotide kinase family protein [Salibaculum sp.]MDR9483172.1 nucleoside/nucleotide kinase family protein [Salibaculum sp.]
MPDLTPQINLLAERVHAMRGDGRRLLVAIAGAPGSGKSTLAEELARRLNAQKCATRVVPMDGFHLDNAVLSERGLLGRKGAPETFDSAGFLHLVQRLRERTEVIAPVFDRNRDLAIAGAQVIPAEAEVVLVEGNYLLFDAAPWFNLAPIWSLSVRLDVPLEDLRARLIQRWLKLGHTRVAATRRAEANDIPNAEAVVAQALHADIVLTPQGPLAEGP